MNRINNLYLSPTLNDVHQLVNDSDRLSLFLQSCDILPRQSLCDSCGTNCRLTFRQDRGSKFLVWRCTAKGCKTTKRALSGTFFAEAKIPINLLIELVYHWAQGLSIRQVKNQTGLTQATVKRWFTRLTDTTSRALIGQGVRKIGGRGHIVQVGDFRLLISQICIIFIHYTPLKTPFIF